jgi:hypothetical protein
MGDNHSPLHRRNLGKTLKERQAEGGTQAQRRRAKFAARKETSGPRAGLTKAVGAHGGSPKEPKPKSQLHKAAEALSGE